MSENESQKFHIVIPGCALVAQARNPYSLLWLWRLARSLPSGAHLRDPVARPGMTHIKHEVFQS